MTEEFVPTRGDIMLLGRVQAGIELLGRSGAQSFELTCESDTPPVAWWAGANWSGTRVFSETYPYPAHAVEELLTKVINGGECRRCGQTTVVGVIVDGLCCFSLIAADLEDADTYRWIRTCEVASRG